MTPIASTVNMHIYQPSWGESYEQCPKLSGMEEGSAAAIVIAAAAGEAVVAAVAELPPWL